jgi:opacity protein-like surface antigen
MKHFVCVIITLFGLLRLNAQNTDMQSSDSLDIKIRDSILLKRINPEDMFHKKIAKIDSSCFDKKEVEKQIRVSYSDFRRWRFGLNGGIEMIIAPEPANISEELLKYKKKLKSGTRFGADAIFFVSPNIGLGIIYSTYSAGNKTNYISYEINGSQYRGARQDDINIHFFGPTISIRSIPKNNKIYTSCDFTLGYFTYSNNSVFNNINHHLKENNFGFATSVGADFMFMKNISMGLSLNITAASIKNAELVSGNSVENLSRISLVMTFKTYR